MKRKRARVSVECAFLRWNGCDNLHEDVSAHGERGGVVCKKSAVKTRKVPVAWDGHRDLSIVTVRCVQKRK